MAFENTAPNLSQFIDLATFKTYFPAPPPPAPPVGEPNATKKAELLQAFKVEYNAQGGAVDLRRLARSQDVPYKWCEILRDEVRDTKAEQYGG